MHKVLCTIERIGSQCQSRGRAQYSIRNSFLRWTIKADNVNEREPVPSEFVRDSIFKKQASFEGLFRRTLPNLCVVSLTNLGFSFGSVAVSLYLPHMQS